MATKNPQTEAERLIEDNQAEEFSELRERIATVRQLQRDYAGPIIAAGVLSGDEVWTNLLGILTRDVELEYRTPVTQLLDQLHKAGHNLLVPHPREDDPEHTEWADDMVFAYAMGYGDKGFILGLAVGMQLGPHAFDAMKTANRNGGGR